MLFLLSFDHATVYAESVEKNNDLIVEKAVCVWLKKIKNKER